MKAVNDLLESRGHIYSDRPPAVMAGELVGWARGLGYTNGPPNPRFREFRKLFHQFMGPRACVTPEFAGMQERETLRLLQKLLDSPKDFYDHCRTSTSSTILLMSYGYSTASDDPLQLVKIAEDAMDGFSRASEPGWLVDSVPILKYVPAWFPGASFQRAARAMRRELDRLYDVPLAFVKGEMARGTAKPSFLSSNLETKGEQGASEQEDLLKAAAGSLYSGGAETTPSALTSFILAMVLHPEIQSRAQAEVDAVCLAHGRMPQVADRSSLPYVNAIVKEVWRWNPSVPLGLPHMANADDVYRGWRVEKGTVVWANIWSILHDETVSPDPFAFRPERYLGKDPTLQSAAEDPNEVVQVAFGVGRRICPGMYLGDQAVFIAICNILFAFDIGKAKDEAGNIITPVVEYGGFISHPRPFRCSIRPRSGPAQEIVQHALEELRAGDGLGA
ncbi:cytochrome P450 [Schizophyllum commune H4-8]|uniref:cytochrome P450 n=1 Tax=Schizophyllum commune (strain H4-8 / FGSC 9210) TaxID=578458 RepID=UPI002160A228|nr:cytochrome P450 [Schizophyllum commune H4-8]KAI5888586.1 cytochrome P450 [Schizophyllum commune H4-8]